MIVYGLSNRQKCVKIPKCVQLLADKCNLNLFQNPTYASRYGAIEHSKIRVRRNSML